MSTPVNQPFLSTELITRNIYHSSQYSHDKLHTDRLYPNHKKESRDFPGHHVCRVSVQRLCHGGWGGVIKSALSTKNPRQELKGFCTATVAVIVKHGFTLETAAHPGNPFHAHIYIRELDLPYPSETAKVLDAGLKRRLDDMSEEFEFLYLQRLDDSTQVHYPSSLCKSCLNTSRD